ncbi:MAG: MqnA/MqnD/SBP family protein, partial [Planctomycetota bacterium]
RPPQAVMMSSSKASLAALRREEAKLDALIAEGEAALASEWRRWTRLPFVFAVWAARPGVETTEVAAALAASRDAGAEASDQIAEQEAPPLGLTVGGAKDYLRHNLHFRLGAAERASLARFRRECEELGLLPEACAGDARG